MDNNVKALKAPSKVRKRKVASLDKKKARTGWWFVLPFIIGFIGVYLPIIITSIRLSFAESFKKQVISGFSAQHYLDLFRLKENRVFLQTLGSGIQQLVFDIPAIVIFALFMAVLLNQKVMGRAVFRAIFFVPVILGTGLIDAIDTNNSVLEGMGSNTGASQGGTSESASAIISNYDLAKLFESMKVGTELVKYITDLVNNIYGIVNRSGVQLLIFLSGLQSISPAIYESCSIDGATTWETFWKITFPMISPMILVNTVYTVIDAFTSSSNSVMELILKTADESQMKSAAMAWTYFTIVILIIALVAAIVSSFVFYQRRD